MAAGCGGGRAAEARLSRLRASLVPVAVGARRCAPRELALAQAHLDFARMELAQGDLGRAREHMDRAEANRGAAVALSPAARCAPGAATMRSVTEAPAANPDPPDAGS